MNIDLDVEVLLVEDTRSDAEMAMRAIRKSNAAGNILHVQDGQEAIDFLFGEGQYAGRNIQIRPKLVLLDLKMPKINGKEVLKRIKSDELTRTIPVVILTSSKENPDIDECYLLGVNSYVVKPVGSAEFMTALVHLATYWLGYNQVP